MMPTEEGERVEGEGEAGTADWRVRTRPKKQTDCKRKGELEATHMPFRDWLHTLHVGQRSHSSPRVEVWECGFVEETNH